MNDNAWKLCSACRAEIPWGALHWVCSVSTCNRARMALVFCSVPCWDSHLATLRHREAWAVEAHAPRNAGEAAEAAASAPGTATVPVHVPVEPPARRVVVPPPAPVAPVQAGEDDVLIVVSRMKKYIRERSQLSTSDGVADALSVHVRALCDEAIRAAVEAGRKTVLDRDVPRIRR